MSKLICIGLGCGWGDNWRAQKSSVGFKNGLNPSEIMCFAVLGQLMLSSTFILSGSLSNIFGISVDERIAILYIAGELGSFLY